MATSYCQLFLWMASLVALSHSERTIQAQVFPSKYEYGLANHLDLNVSFIYHDEACQSVSESIECSTTMHGTSTPKLIDCDLGPDNGQTTKSFYSLKLNSSLDQHHFAFTFDNTVNITALSLHYYCAVDTQENTSFCVNVLATPSVQSPCLLVPCVDNQKQIKKTLEPSEKLFMTIESDHSFQLYISEVQFFIEVPVINGSSDDHELRTPCSVFTSDVPSSCDHWWVDYESNDDIQENVTLSVHNKPPECGSNNTSSVHVEEHGCEIVVEFQDDCGDLMPTVSLSVHDSALPTTSTPTIPPGGTRDSNAAVIAGAIIGVVAGLTLCGIVSLIFIIYLLSRRRKESLSLEIRKSNLVTPLNVHNRSVKDHPVLESTFHSESTAADAKPTQKVADNPLYRYVESQPLDTTQNSSTGQPLLYDEVKNRDHSRIKDHTHLHATETEGDSAYSQLNSEPTYCLATPSVIQIDPTYSRLNLQDSRAAAKEQDPAYSHLDHKTITTVQNPAYSHLDHKTTATVQDPTYSHLDHKTTTVKQDPTYSHIHHRLTAEEQTSTLDDEYARLDCKTATQKPAPVSADYSHIKLDREALTEKQDPTTSS